MKALIKIGGSLLDDPASRNDIARQIAQVAASGVTVTVVHGGGKQMTRFLEERGIQSRFVRGLRVTTDETIDAVLKVLAGTVNTQLTAALCAAGVKAVGLTGIDAGLAMADQLDPELGFVGRVIASDPTVLDALTDAGMTPVVACVAGSVHGQVFNVNGDSMAVAVASRWGVDRLLFLTDVPGVLDAKKEIIPVLTAEDCAKLIATGVATGGMQAKLNAATDAVANGVHEVCIVKGSDADIVKRVFEGKATGTSIVGPHHDPLFPIMTAIMP
ncbi:MAG TPA: acetylglutamate kinase [Bryobacteraceae bacterium]|nr:acetylglutamate kinase [Bryobacteraceae bacterium]